MSDDKKPALFSVDPAPTFTSPVQITAPGGEKRALLVTYRHKGKAALAEWRKSVETRPPEEEADILLEIITDWQAAETFNRPALERLLDGHYGAAQELYLAYLAGLSGARLGN